MNLNVIIVDDEPLARSVLTGFVNNHPSLTLVGTCSSADEAERTLNDTSVDLILLDIQMPLKSGIDFYRTLASKPQVVFTTAHPEFAVEGFELNATDYLMKPIPFERFLVAINKVLSRVNNSESDEKYLIVKSDGRMYRIDYKNIVFFESIGDFLKIHTEKEVIICSIRLKELEEILPKDQFIRIHKSFTVAIKRVQFMEGNNLSIADKMLPIGRVYKDRVRQIF